jgi:hypothetical protein
VVRNARAAGICVVLLFIGLSLRYPEPSNAEVSQPGIAGTTSAIKNSAVAIFSGPPKDGLACNGSLTIGDNVGWYRNGKPGTITDINLIEEVSAKPSIANHVRDTVTAGWLYLDERGNYWVQMNGHERSQISSKTRAFFAALGLRDTRGGIATTGRHLPNVRSANLLVQRCWSHGKDFASANS